MEALEKVERDNFYVELMQYVNGQQSGITADTFWERMAEIAKTLIIERPELALPTAKEEFMAAAIDTFYERDHVLRVQR